MRPSTFWGLWAARLFAGLASMSFTVMTLGPAVKNETPLWAVLTVLVPCNALIFCLYKCASHTLLDDL